MYTITTITNDQEETIKVRGIKQAYAAYDAAVSSGKIVKSFTNKFGTELADHCYVG